MTTNEADGPRLTSVPSTVAVPPGVSVCPGAIQNCVAALAVSVDEPMVKTGGGAAAGFAEEVDPVGKITLGSVEVLDPTIIAVPEGASETKFPPIRPGLPPGCKVTVPTATMDEGPMTTGLPPKFPTV